MRLIKKIDMSHFKKKLRNVITFDKFTVFFTAKKSFVFVNLLTGKHTLEKSFLRSDKDILLSIPEKEGLVIGSEKNGLQYAGAWKDRIDIEKVK